MIGVRREIGSEFWEIPAGARNDHFPDNTQWFVSGRAALQQIIAQCRPGSAALPSWCCDSMIEPFLQAGVEVRFYPVYAENGLVQDLRNVDADCVLVMDYFGYHTDADLSGYRGTVIRDLTHSVFSAGHRDAHYYFGSLRKWAGFWTGGYGWGLKPCALPEDEVYNALRKTAMERKARYISGASDDKDYLQLFSQAEDHLERLIPAGAADRDIACAGTLDIAFIKQRRRANAARLLEAFSQVALFPEMAEGDCPLFVPILVPDGKRDALRRHLIGQEIYCPVHWSVSGCHKLDAATETIYRQELSLVCDQRYTPADMDRVIEQVNKFWKECT